MAKPARGKVHCTSSTGSATIREILNLNLKRIKSEFSLRSKVRLLANALRTGPITAADKFKLQALDQYRTSRRAIRIAPQRSVFIFPFFFTFLIYSLFVNSYFKLSQR